MPRVINLEDYQQKRSEILGVAQRLIYTRGYENMAIQEILNELKISKGAFYHYFDSKQALLEGLVDHMRQEVELFLGPIANDPDLPVFEKMERFFGSVASWKTARKAYLTQIMHAWYGDHNAILRQKLTAAGVQWMAPYLTQIIQQGVREGVMHPAGDLTAEVAQVAIALMISLGEGLATSIVALGYNSTREQQYECLRRIENLALAYRAAIERVLGAPPGSITLFDLNILREWVLEPDPTPEAISSPPA